jgi:hypothetical protein
LKCSCRIVAAGRGNLVQKLSVHTTFIVAPHETPITSIRLDSQYIKVKNVLKEALLKLASCSWVQAGQSATSTEKSLQKEGLRQVGQLPDGWPPIF